MSSKIDSITTLKDRQHKRADEVRSNASYVEDLKNSRSEKPPKKLFKKKKDELEKPKKEEKRKKQEDQNIIKEKAKQVKTAEREEQVNAKAKKSSSTIDKTFKNNLDVISLLLQESKSDDQGSELNLMDKIERFELSQEKYLEIKDKLSEKQQNKIEQSLEKVLNQIQLLKLKNEFPVPIIENNILEEEDDEDDGEDDDGFGLGGDGEDEASLIDSPFDLAGFGILKKKEEEEEEEDKNKK